MASGTNPDSRGFIVGEVTIKLARLVSVAVPGQFLIGSYMRELGVEDEEIRRLVGVSAIDTPSFMAFAQGNVQRLVGQPIGDGQIISTKVYLTGEKVSDSEFSVKKYQVRDKHGLEHACFNVKCSVRRSTGEPVDVGLQDRELGEFNAWHQPGDDLRIRMV